MTPSCSSSTWATSLFFFSSRRRHTRSLRDWSSDVCSSDLSARQGESVYAARAPRGGRHDHAAHAPRHPLHHEIGRASCRERVEISVVAVALKNKIKQLNRSAHIHELDQRYHLSHANHDQVP